MNTTSNNYNETALYEIPETFSDLLEELKEIIAEKKAEGKKIAAFIAHEFIPLEIIELAGYFPLPLIFAGNEETMTIGGDYLTPTTCCYARSLIGLFQNAQEGGKYGFLKNVDVIIVSNYCTSDLLVGEAISKNFNIPMIEFFLPMTHGIKQKDYYAEQIKFLYGNLIKLKNSDQIDSNLKVENFSNSELLEVRKILESFDKLRKIRAQIWQYDLKNKEKLMLYLSTALFGRDVANPIAQLLAHKKCINVNDIDTKTNSNVDIRNNKLIFTGCSIFIDDPLIDLLEESGAEIGFFHTWIGNLENSFQNGKSLSLENHSDKIARISSFDDVISYLADELDLRMTSMHFVQDSIKKNSSVLERISKQINSKFVINHILKFCDIIGFNREQFRKSIISKGLKIINLERDYSRAMKGQLSTRLEAFLEMNNN